MEHRNGFLSAYKLKQYNCYDKKEEECTQAASVDGGKVDTFANTKPLPKEVENLIEDKQQLAFMEQLSQLDDFE